MNSPWSVRPIREKLYGPTLVTTPITVDPGTPAFVEIPFPCWTKTIYVAANTNSTARWAAVPRNQLQSAPFLLADPNVFMPPTFTNALSSNVVPLAISTHILTLLNTSTTTPVTWRFFAVLTDVPAPSMPELTADKGVWATYNGIDNDPT